MTQELPTVHVFHTGALGDSILLWPMLRRLRRSSRVTLVTERAKGQLAARELGIDAIDIEQRKYTALWSADALQRKSHEQSPARPTPGHVGEFDIDQSVTRIISFLTDQPTSDWASNARVAFPNAAIEFHSAPLDRWAALELGGNEGSIGVVCENEQGPVVLHVGAGARAKLWPLDRWCELASLVHRRATSDRSVKSISTATSSPPSPAPIAVIAGEVEAERFSGTQRDLFARLQGRIITDLETLVSTLRAARLFIGNDSGPTHLAAQLGVPTVALFGPTDPNRWAPIGPRVTVIAPESPSPMDWLSAERVVGTIRA